MIPARRPSAGGGDLLTRVRQVVLLARAVPVLPPEQLSRALARLDPPADPAGPGWRLLLGAVETYTAAVRPPASSPDAVETARRGVVLAAAALVSVEALWLVAGNSAALDREVV